MENYKDKFESFDGTNQQNVSNNKILQELKDYFKNTPREKVLQDWQQAKENSAKNSPTVEDFKRINNL